MTDNAEKWAVRAPGRSDAYTNLAADSEFEAIEAFIEAAESNRTWDQLFMMGYRVVPVTVTE